MVTTKGYRPISSNRGKPNGVTQHRETLRVGYRATSDRVICRGPETDPQSAADLLAAGAMMIDIREADEWEEVRIPGATFRPLSEINDWYEGLPRDRTVILQCRSGNRSAMATAALLNQAGFENVVNLAGGIIAWHQADLPIDLKPLPH